MKALFVLIFSLVTFSAAANAGILLEPYVGYESGKAVTDLGGYDKTQAPIVGGRLGGEISNFFLAADYKTSVNGKFEDSSGFKGKVRVTSLYGVAGINIMMIRLWAGYGFQNEHELQITPSLTNYGGTSYKFGFGLKLFSNVSLNAEYAVIKFKKEKVGGVYLQEFNTKYTPFIVSLSAPITFF